MNTMVGSGRGSGPSSRQARRRSFEHLCLDPARDGADRAIDRYYSLISTDYSFERAVETFRHLERVLETLASTRSSSNSNTQLARLAVQPPIAAILVAGMHFLQSPRDIIIAMDVTLEEVYQARIKKLVVLLSDASRVTLYVSLLEPSEEHRFIGHGDAHALTGERGDIVVRIVVLPHPTFSIDTVLSIYDLNTTVYVPFLDYLYGNTYKITHLDGNVLEVTYEAQSGRMGLAIEGKGLSKGTADERGTLHVFFEVILPVVDPPDALHGFIGKTLLHKLFG